MRLKPHPAHRWSCYSRTLRAERMNSADRVQAAEGSILSDLGLDNALGVTIMDKRREPDGMMIVGRADATVEGE